MESSRREAQGVEGSRAITSDDFPPSRKILHITTKGVKLHGTVVIRGKLANGNEIINKVRKNKNIIKTKLVRKACNTSGSNSNEVHVTENNVRRMTSSSVREDTSIGDHTLVAPKSKYHSCSGNCCKVMVWKLAARDCGSHPGAVGGLDGTMGGGAPH